MTYQFKLRLDMPQGFKSNSRYPELPAINQFLSQYDNKQFKNPDEFKASIRKCPDFIFAYLKNNNLNRSTDAPLATGLYLENYESNSLIVFCKSAENHIGTCAFGTLERIAQSKERKAVKV